MKSKPRRQDQPATTDFFLRRVKTVFAILDSVASAARVGFGRNFLPMRCPRLFQPIGFNLPAQNPAGNIFITRLGTRWNAAFDSGARELCESEWPDACHPQEKLAKVFPQILRRELNWLCPAFHTIKKISGRIFPELRRTGLTQINEAATNKSICWRQIEFRREHVSGKWLSVARVGMAEGGVPHAAFARIFAPDHRMIFFHRAAVVSRFID